MIINQRYEIIKKLGEGRSKVFLCQDRDASKLVAMKILENIKDNFEIETFKNEYFTLNRLSHPNIIKCFKYGTVLDTEEKDEKLEITSGSLFFTLEYFEGSPIFDYHGTADENQLHQIIKQISSALYYLHQSNYIYSDIKSENILVADSPSGPVVRLIDFGFTKLFSPTEEIDAVGTAEYIAPEILKHEICDHRIDLYALGILLYKIVYKTFPFERNSEIEIYKSHLDKEFDFPKTKYSSALIGSIKKLLRKDPEDRYLSTLQILFDLKLPVTNETKTDWVPAQIFSEKIHAISAVNLYITDKTRGDMLTLRGGEGSGKSPILEELNRTFPNTILFKSSEVENELDYWKTLLKKMLYCPAIFNNLSKEIIEEVKTVMVQDNLDITTALRSLFSKMLFNKELTLLFDGYNEFDSFNRDLINQLILAAQINKIKVILTEHTRNTFYSEELQNIVVFDLVPYNKKDIDEIFNKRFAAFFPKRETKSLILKYAELNPGGLMNFFREIISNGILNFKYEGPFITSNIDLLNYLKTGRQERLKSKINLLEKDELLLAQYISAINAELGIESLSKLAGIPFEDARQNMQRLVEKNIVQISKGSETINFSDSEFKTLFLGTIINKKEFYFNLAGNIKEQNIQINKGELARLFEAGEDFKTSYSLYMDEMETAEKINALQYQRNIITHLLKFPLETKRQIDFKIQLAEILLKLSENKKVLNLTNLILKSEIVEQQKLTVLILKGSALIRIGEAQQGKDILNSVLVRLTDPSEKARVMLETADAEFDLSNFGECEEICRDVLTNKSSSQESLGKAHNLLGMIKFFNENNLDDAIAEFEKALELFKATKLTVRYAGTKVNLGNLHFLKGDQKNAEKHWSEALNINRDIGNLDQEAKLLLSYGIYFFENLQFEKAIEYQKRAQNIFSSFGDKNGLGLVLTNLGEIFLETCDYQEAYEALEEANFIFKQLSNTEEEAQVIFMLSKLFDTIGHRPKLLNSIKYYERLVENNKLSEKHSLNISFLKEMTNVGVDEIADDEPSLKTIRDQFWEVEDRSNYIQAGIRLVERLISAEKFDEAFLELHNENFEKICAGNNLYKAYYLYLMGELSKSWNSSKLDSAIEYYQKAYEIISNENITELTWKVVFALAESYSNRGNFSKAEEYIISSKYLIQFISENLEDAGFKEAYLNNSQRMNALKKLEEMEEKL